MTSYVFEVKEVSRGSLIAWDAIEISPCPGHPIPLQGQVIAGAYPEIADHLAQHHSLEVILTYAPALGDSFDQAGQTWTFVRGANQITVIDMPRTILRMSISS